MCFDLLLHDVVDGKGRAANEEEEEGSSSGEVKKGWRHMTKKSGLRAVDAWPEP